MNFSDFEVESFSFPGRSKPNQDGILIKTLGADSLVLGIADGMGGKPGGNIASNIALETIDAEMERDPGVTVSELFSSVKRALDSQSSSSPELGEMGTTLSICVIRNNKVTVGHVGDCRVYLLRRNGIVSMTKDQTEVQRLLDDGILPRHMAKDYPRRNILLSVMSASSQYELQESSFTVQADDRILLMSDGAYSLFSKSEIRDLSVHSPSTTGLKSQILKVIQTRPIKDDYSAIICTVL